VRWPAVRIENAEVRAEGLEKGAGVGDDDEGAGVEGEGLLEGVLGFDLEVVGGLVDQQEIERGEKETGEGEFGALAVRGAEGGFRYFLRTQKGGRRRSNRAGRIRQPPLIGPGQQRGQPDTEYQSERGSRGARPLAAEARRRRMPGLGERRRHSRRSRQSSTRRRTEAPHFRANGPVKWVRSSA
jgi:hypothetical protein